MSQLLRRLLDPAYLYAIDPGPLGRWRVIYIVWAALLLVGSASILWRRRRNAHPALSVAATACVAGLLSLLLRLLAPRLAPLWQARFMPAGWRFLLLDAWTARVWPISATVVALLALVLYAIRRVRLPVLLERQVCALSDAIALEDSPLSGWQSASLAVVHLAGLAWLWHLAGLAAWWALPSLALLSALPLLARPRRLRLETLAPLFLSYLSATAYVLLARRWDIDIEEYQSFALPDPWSPWFNVPAVVAAGIAYTLWIQLRLLARRKRALAWASATAVLLALWMTATIATHRTYGVTASDPYCYVQMAIDLAETGSPLHDFPLAGLARQLALPTWPTVHVGYHPPVIDTRSPTMWPIGWSALLVPFYWVGGLSALYFAAPLMSAGALVATWLLVSEGLRSLGRTTRWAVAGLACLLVATSPEGSERMLVPMADGAAQLFTTLALWLLLRSQQRRPLRHSLLAGLSLGVAYQIRHPQLPLALAALAAAFLSPQPVRRRFLNLALFGLGGLVVAFPDLLYHRQVFGGWLNTESSEWFLVSWQNVGRSASAILEQGLLRREELGFLAPFAIYGAWLLWRRHRGTASILAAGLLPVFAFHLCYAALRPRDLIAILPALYLCAAYGFVRSWQWAGDQRSPIAAVWLTACVVLLSARSYRTVSMPWRDDVTTFGYVPLPHYQGFLALRDLTAEEAVIASMLNGGAIELYAGREAVHPAPWTEEELHRWVDALRKQGRPMYVLEDGEEMGQVMARLQSRYKLYPVQTLALPYFALGGGSLPQPVRLYKVGAIQGNG